MQRIVLINGMDDAITLEGVKSRDRLHFEIYNLADMKIDYCCGCFGCWVKTPGRCIQDDDMPGILREIINSDLTIFLSPLVMGFVNSRTKKVNDKMIPLVHPYIGLFGGECHHHKRYDKYPKLGLILVGQNQESLKIVTYIYQRLAINLKTELAFSILSDTAVGGVENALNNI